MAKKKQERDMKYFCGKSADQKALTGILDIHLPYDIPEYKRRVLNRGILSHKQYIDYLATPKGYRWNKDTGLMEPWAFPNVRCYTQRQCFKENDEPLLVTDQRFIQDFLTDVWNYLTPEMINRLKGILMEDLKMTEMEAERFLVEQRVRSTFNGQKVATRFLLSSRHGWVREYAAMLSGKVRDYLVLMLDSARTQRIKCLARTLGRKLGEMTGEECSPDGASPFQQGEMWLSDRLAVWLGGILEKERDSRLCRREHFQEEAEEDYGPPPPEEEEPPTPGVQSPPQELQPSPAPEPTEPPPPAAVQPPEQGPPPSAPEESLEQAPPPETPADQPAP